MRYLKLHMETPEHINGNIRHSCLMERCEAAGSGSTERLFYDIPESVKQIGDDDGEPFLIATIMSAMEEHRDLHVGGAVSASLLANLEEYMAAWHCCLPDRYGRIALYADTVAQFGAPDPLVAAKAVSAFSGGIDAAFTVWSHMNRAAGNHSQEIKCCAMVHGFDIPICDEPAFRRPFNESAETLSSVGLPLIPIVTNYRVVLKVNWEHVFAAALVSAMQFLKKEASIALVGSSNPYNRLIFPWGSSPVSDHLLSSDSFRVIHDGAAYNRTQKAAAVATWREGCAHLRVCWEGDAKKGNCGRCEKCIRTKLNFMANGLAVPESLGEAPTCRQIRGVRLRSAAVRSEYNQILKAAEEHMIKDEWVTALRYLLLIGPIKNIAINAAKKCFKCFRASSNCVSR